MIWVILLCSFGWLLSSKVMLVCGLVDIMVIGFVFLCSVFVISFIVV